MFIRLNKRKAQSTLEYAVIIGVVVGALIMMQVYVKRGLQGKMKEASDQIGDQYSPTQSSATTTTQSSVNSTENVVGGNDAYTKSTTNQSQNRDTTQNTGSLNSEGSW
ncbi:MAG: hypothetical protein NT060_04585 [Candidatus Omnitrophica bacterium]|nr:hypothetical protein [Candidatus Omnitrophota bacterium]